MSSSQAVRIAVGELYRELPDTRLSGHDLAYAEGKAARKAGLSLESCPYLSCIDPACRSLWLSGFYTA